MLSLENYESVAPSAAGPCCPSDDPVVPRPRARGYRVIDFRTPVRAFIAFHVSRRRVPTSDQGCQHVGGLWILDIFVSRRVKRIRFPSRKSLGHILVRAGRGVCQCVKRNGCVAKRQPDSRCFPRRRCSALVRRHPPEGWERAS
jgi:hypothetical protein